MALPRLPHHLSLLINTGRKRAGSRSEGSEPAGLAASLAGAGGAGAVPCCSAGPCWEETPSPHPPGMGIRSAHRARPCPGAETRVIALMSTAQGYPGATEVGRGRSKDFTRLSRGKGWPGGFTCHGCGWHWGSDLGCTEELVMGLFAAQWVS